MQQLFNVENLEIILGVVILILIYIIRNLYKQREQLETVVYELIDTLDDVNNNIDLALKNMQDIDNRQVFEKDDEVGTTFYILKNTVENLEQTVYEIIDEFNKNKK